MNSLVDNMGWVGVAALAGLVTFGLRLSFIALVDSIELPEPVRQALRFVPVAVFSAIVAPLLLVTDGQLDIALDNLSIWAALVASLVAWKTRSVLYTVIAGMVTLWLLIYLTGSAG